MGSYIRISVIQVYFLEWFVINQTDVAIGVYLFFSRPFFSTPHAHMNIKEVSSFWQYQSCGKIN